MNRPTVNVGTKGHCDWGVKPTTAQIKEWLDKHPDTFGRNADLVGILLIRLEAAEELIKDIGALPDRWRNPAAHDDVGAEIDPPEVVDCAVELQAKLKDHEQ